MTKQDQSEIAKKGRNYAIMFALIALVVIVFVVTLIRMGGAH